MHDIPHITAPVQWLTNGFANKRLVSGVGGGAVRRNKKVSDYRGIFDLQLTQVCRSSFKVAERLILKFFFAV